MTSLKKIEANRRNALRSTGPRTPEGKERARANALRHGLRAEGPGALPNEDPEAYRARVDAWLSYYEPANPAEAELVGHAAELSWRLDRAARFETALLTKRVREAVAGAGKARRRRAYAAYRQLLPEVYAYHKSGHDGLDLGELRAEIESSPEGCRLLIAAWNELLAYPNRGHGWPKEIEFHVIRLLKRDDGAVVTEPEIVAVAVADRTLTHPEIPMIPRNWTEGFGFTFGRAAVRRGCELKPEGREEALRLITGVAEREIARLEGVLASLGRLDEIDAAEAEEAGILALFDPSPEGERLRRYQLAIRRELTRTLDQLARLRALESKQKFIHSDNDVGDGIAGDAPPPGPDPDAPNEAKSTAAVQAPFTFERDRAVEPEGAKGPIMSNRPRPLTGRERAIARMVKKARKGR